MKSLDDQLAASLGYERCITVAAFALGLAAKLAHDEAPQSPCHLDYVAGWALAADACMDAEVSVFEEARLKRACKALVEPPCRAAANSR